MNVYTFGALIGPLLGLLVMLIGQKKYFPSTNIILMMGTALGLVASMIRLITDAPGEMRVNALLSSLILLVSLNIQKFSVDYMRGDSAIYRYFIKLGLLTFSANAMVLVSDDMLFWLFWTMNGLILASLMIHKSQWQAAKYSGIYTVATLMLGSLSLGLALAFPKASISLYLLVVAAMCQSAIWPFHRWLLSSLNSPTPVSALMHAGLVNGGGVLLIRYHAWLIQDTGVMNSIFLAGLFTALCAGFWKLIQVDIKKMLANSTMAQMGFMLMQCGMGLFPAALAHLCWHGLFKAYLFLNAGMAVGDKVFPESSDYGLKEYAQMVLVTVLGLICFAYTAHIDLNIMNTYLLLLLMVVITLWQLSKGLVGTHYFFLSLFFVSVCSALYGQSVWLIEGLFSDGASLALPLQPLYVIGMGLLISFWVLINGSWFGKLKTTRLGIRAYMWAINASQPFSKTITSIRKTYHI